MLEICLQVYGATISADLRKIEAIPGKARRLAQSPALRMLMLGNSWTICGIEPDSFRSHAKLEFPSEPTLEIVQFHGSSLCEWYWIFRCHFVDENLKPDIILVNLMPASVLDRGNVRYRRLARHFDLLSKPFLPLDDLPDFEVASQFFLAKVSVLFSRAQGIGKVALGKFIPHLEETRKWINETASVRAKAERRKNGSDGQDSEFPDEYTGLRRLLTLTSESGVLPVFMFMPTRDGYDIPDELARIIRAGGGMLIDTREAVDLDPDDFVDGIHLKPSGAEKFTPAYVKILALELAGRSTPPPAPSENAGSAD